MSTVFMLGLMLGDAGLFGGFNQIIIAAGQGPEAPLHTKIWPIFHFASSNKLKSLNNSRHPDRPADFLAFSFKQGYNS